MAYGRSRTIVFKTAKTAHQAQMRLSDNELNRVLDVYPHSGGGYCVVLDESAAAASYGGDKRRPRTRAQRVKGYPKTRGFRRKGRY